MQMTNETKIQLNFQRGLSCNETSSGIQTKQISAEEMEKEEDPKSDA